MAFLRDGFSTTIGFSLIGALLREKDVSPPGLVGGGGIETTTMRNTRLRTFAPKSLYTLTEMTFTASYDTFALSQLFSVLQARQTITVTFPDGTTFSFWGFLDEFKPMTLKEGEFPLAEVKIIPSNRDAATGLEVPPTFPLAGASLGVIA